MDGKKNPPDLRDQDEEEIKNLMGEHYSKRVDVVSQSPHNPQKTNLPKRPENPGGIKPIFPLVPEDQVHLYEQKTRKPDEVFGNFQHGKIDQELNELALREVAESRGITVEELLKQKPDKKLEEKLGFADMSDEKNVERVKQEVTDSIKNVIDTAHVGEDLDIETLELELKRIELQQKLARAKAGGGQTPEAPVPPPVPPKPKVKKKTKPKVAASKVHPLLKELRQKFSLDAIEINVVKVEGIEFGMLPAPSSLHGWVFDKLQAASFINSQQAMNVAIRSVIVSSTLVQINGVPLVEILGLMDGEKAQKYLDAEHRELLAQTLWEMITGTVSIDGLFTFEPRLVTHLYEQYEKTFPEKSFGDVQLDSFRRYVCPMDDCEEVYEQEPPESGVVFCKVHAVPMEDVGLLKEVHSLPLA